MSTDIDPDLVDTVAGNVVSAPLAYKDFAGPGQNADGQGSGFTDIRIDWDDAYQARFGG